MKTKTIINEYISKLLSLLLLLSGSFSHPLTLIIFFLVYKRQHSPQFSRTLLSNLGDLNNAVVWMTSSRLFYFQVHQSVYQFFSDCTRSTNYNWYNRHFLVPKFFQFPSKVQVFIILFAFFQICPVVSQDKEVYILQVIFFYCFKVWSFDRD